MELCLSVWAGVVDSCKSTRAIYCEARGERGGQGSRRKVKRKERRKEGVSFGPHTAHRTQEQREEVMAL